MQFSYTTGALAATAFALLGGTATAQWSDNFDSYNHGDALEVVGAPNGWESWSSGIPTSFVVGAAPAPTPFSAPNCMDNVPGADTVNNYGPGFATAGKWVFEGYNYIPSSAIGRTYFIMLNTYQFTGPYDWSVQTYWDMDTNAVDCDCAGNNVGGIIIVRDTWIPFRAEIDLDLDTVDIFYNGNSLTGNNPYIWTEGVFGGGSGLLEIQALDLYPNGAAGSSMYYDDLELHPEIQDLGTPDPVCQVLSNSSGFPALLTLQGTGAPTDPIQAQVSQGPTSQPGEFGFIIGSDAGGGLYFVPPGASGFICTNQPIYRWNSGALGHVYQFDAAGVGQSTGGGGPVTLQMDGTFSNIPASAAGQTWAFQGWFRDLGGSTANFSESKLVTF